MGARTSGVPTSKDGHGRTKEGYKDASRVLADAYSRTEGVGELGGAKGAIRRVHATRSGADDSDAEVSRQHGGPIEKNTERKERLGL